MSNHEHHSPKTDDWQTPKYIIDALPTFDLDPCASDVQRIKTATRMIQWPNNGLSDTWSGAVWLNPPYSKNEIEKWLIRMANHGDGVALIPARIETKWFHRLVWPHASGLFVFKGRLTYEHRELASKRSGRAANAMFPSVLAAYGERCCGWLRDVNLDGWFLGMTDSAARGKTDNQMTMPTG